MPHRATYIFPRQFPERGLDELSKKLLDHDKDKIVNSIESDIQTKRSFSSSTPPTTKHDVVFSSGKHSYSSGEKLRIKQNQIAAFCDWFIDKKRNHSGHQTYHHLRRRSSISDDDHDFLLHQPESVVKETAIDRNFDRQVSLPRLSSDSSYAGSLFSSDIKEETPLSQVSTITTATARRQKEEEEEDRGALANKCKESYILQLKLAKRLTSLASLVTEPFLTSGTENWDDDSVSYRLWVHNNCTVISFVNDISLMHYETLIQWL